MPTIHTNGVPLHYRRSGNTNNRTMIFAHSVLWGVDSFKEMLTELEKEVDLITVGIHGHGASGYRDEMTLEEMTEDFYLLLRRLNLEKVIWFGCSIGRMIGMRLALSHPDAVDSLILMSTTAQLDPPEIKEMTLHLWKMFREGHREDIAGPAMPFFFSPRTFQDRPELVEEYKNRIVLAKDVRGMFAAALSSFTRTDISEDIRRITIPTLVIAGRDDPATSPAHARFIAAQIQDARLEIIEDANHLVGIEKPSAINKLVRDFLNSTAKR